MLTTSLVKCGLFVSVKKCVHLVNFSKLSTKPLLAPKSGKVIKPVTFKEITPKTFLQFYEQEVERNKLFSGSSRDMFDLDEKSDGFSDNYNNNLNGTLIQRSTEQTIKEFYDKHVFDTNPSEKIAILISLQNLEHLKIDLGNSLVINKFHSFFDMFEPDERGIMKNRESYDTVVDIRSDRKFWDEIGERNDSGLLLGTEQSKTVAVDCILHEPRGSPEFFLLNIFYNSSWKTYTERHQKPIHNPEITLYPTGKDIRTWVPNRSYRAHVRGGGFTLEKWQSIVNQLNTVSVQFQEKYNGFGWFTGVPQFTVVNFETDETKLNQFATKRTAHKYILPVDSQQVFEWIQDGSVSSNKVILVQSRSDICRYLNAKYRFSNYHDFNTLFASNAETVVFYCNNCNSNSPQNAKEYFDWLRKTHPKSKQKVVLLDRGINGLYRYLENKKTSKSIVDDIFPDMY